MYDICLLFISFPLGFASLRFLFIFTQELTGEGISDKAAAENVFLVTRDEEDDIVQETAQALKKEDSYMETLVEGLTDYSVRAARANLSQQEVDVYLDNMKSTCDTEVRLRKTCVCLIMITVSNNCLSLSYSRIFLLRHLTLLQKSKRLRPTKTTLLK